jgi:hypothetical protein
MAPSALNLATERIRFDICEFWLTGAWWEIHRSA